MSLIDQLFSLKGRTALITGGSSGLGAEMGRCLAAAGAHVLLLGRREEELIKISKEIQLKKGKSDFITMDLFDKSAPKEILIFLKKHDLSVDILINSAGVNLRKSSKEVTYSDWEKTIHLNLSVPFFLAQALFPYMAEKKWGRVINIGSLQSVRAFPDSMPYGASKGGVVQLTRAMAEAWSSSGVMCNAIAPGLFPTELTASLYKDPVLIQRMAKQTCTQRTAELKDIHGLTLFLASKASDFVTGQTIFLDGGYTAK